MTEYIVTDLPIEGERNLLVERYWHGGRSGGQYRWYVSLDNRRGRRTQYMSRNVSEDIKIMLKLYGRDFDSILPALIDDDIMDAFNE